MLDQRANNSASATQDAVDRTIRERRSIRAFLPTAVPQQLVAEILEVAARAPSGTNIQPWQVIALAGEARQLLCERVLHAYQHEPGQHQAEFDYYPNEFIEPYISRRRQTGFGLYALLGIAKGDSAAMQRQTGRNFSFFDAPVGLIFTMDRTMNYGGWIDSGMFMQNIALAARARGLDTCVQAAWSFYPRLVGEVLELADSQVVVCGMALGYADPAAAENRLCTEREAVANFTCFRGF